MKLKSLCLIFSIGIFLLVCVELIVGVIYFKNQKSREFTLIKEEGEIYYKSGEKEEYQTLDQEELLLKEGSFVKTGNGFAQVIFEDNSIMSIGENSEVEINIDKDGTTIEQIAGDTWHRIKSVVSGNEYSVETSSTVATVRGTKFGVRMEKGVPSIFTIKGKVGYMKRGEKLEEMLEAGNMATFEKTGKFKRFAISEDFKKSDWYIRNQRIDELFDQGITRKELLQKIRERRQEILNNIQNQTSTRTESPTISTPTNPENTEISNSLSQADFEKLLDEIDLEYNIDRMITDGCKKVFDPVYSERQKKLESFRGQDFFVTEDAALARYLILLYKYCQDFELVDYEIKELQTLYQQADMGNPNAVGSIMQ